MAWDFAGNVGVTCFAASYALGLAHECVRVRWPRLASWPTLVAAGAGLAAQALYLGYRGSVQGRLPISAPSDALLAVSFVVGLLHLYLAAVWHDRRLHLGLFLLPLNLGLVLIAALALDREPSSPALGSRIVLTAHGLFLLGGAAFIALGTIVAGMYLAKTRQLRSANAPRLALPSLERLDRMNALALRLGWPLTTIGLGLGFAPRKLAWSDPKVWTSVLAWAGFTWLAHYRFQAERRGARVAWCSLIVGGLMLLAILADPLLGTAHQAAKSP